MSGYANLRPHLDDPGFSPKDKDVPALTSMLADADDDLASKLERALLRKPEGAAKAAAGQLAAAGSAFAVRLCRLLSKLGSREESVSALLPVLTGEDARTRRAAARALGNMQDARIEEALLGAWERATAPEERKVLADALGKTGGARALAALSSAEARGDALLDKKQTRAKLAIARTIARGDHAAIDPTKRPKVALPIVWRCRDGLEEMLATELADFSTRKVSPGRVPGTLESPLTLARALEARLALSVAFPLPEQRIEKAGLAAAIVAAIVSSDAAAVFDAFTPKGTITVRLSFAGAGHQRALAWDVAERLAKESMRIANDPTDATWSCDVRAFADSVKVELSPRSVQDARFAYRLRDVPAASHPTIAAALARVARPQKRDVVWDPFCGSGAELIECARLAPGLTLVGTDTSEAALAAMRENLGAAALVAEVALADARTFTPKRAPNLIVTNPPMGRRVQRTGELGTLLADFVAHAAKVLAPGGALVWLSPQPELRDVAVGAGLRVAYERRVDLGGFFAMLLRLEKPVAPTEPARRRLVTR